MPLICIGPVRAETKCFRTQLLPALFVLSGRDVLAWTLRLNATLLGWLGYNGAVCDLITGCEGIVRLSLNVRGVGDVTVIRCSGRIVAGAEAEALRDQVSRLLEDHSDIVLHLGEVVFVDSSGLGMLVRLLTRTRRANGDLKLCNVAQDVHRILKLTNLITLFDTHESEEDAVSAFYQRRTNARAVQCKGPAVLCVDESADVLAYLRELLRSAGYQVLTNSNLPDSLILIRATRPRLIIVGPSLRSSPATRRAFESKCATTPVVELGDEFSTLHAGKAASQLLETIRIRLDPSLASFIG